MGAVPRVQNGRPGIALEVAGGGWSRWLRISKESPTMTSATDYYEPVILKTPSNTRVVDVTRVAKKMVDITTTTPLFMEYSA